jgi:hypothetical protein
MQQLSIAWAGLLGQEFGIVKVKDCRGSDYVQEVAKYVVKGSELAKWSGEKIWEFILAIKGVRFFAAFGSLFAMTKEIKRQLALQERSERTCECGCADYIIESEAAAVLNEIRQKNRGKY